MRFFKAYGTTLEILFRYLLLMVVGKFISEERRAELFARAHDRTARKIVHTLLELKGIYIKLGQTLSIMGNFLPARFTEGLESLQDAVPPHPFEEVQERFLHDFGKPAEELFASIDPTPIASASLGQVHVAYAKSGEKLAVKIQYPDIEEITRKDLKTIRHIFSLVHFVFPQYNLKNVYEEAAAVVMLELDYRVEADNISKISRNFAGVPKFLFPVVFKELSSDKVLTTAFIEGAKITDTKKLESFGINKTALAQELIEYFCKQIFIDGIYHADPHPGNIIIAPDGKIAMVDFGAAATVSPAMRNGLTQFVEGLIKKDTKLLGAAIKQMGFVAKNSNSDETLEKVVEYFYSKISTIKIESFSNLNISQFQEINDLVELKKMDISLRELTTMFLIPREWILLERTLLLLMGLTAQLDDRLNPVEIVVPYVEKFLLGKDKTLKDLLITASKDLVLSYVNLPGELNKTLKKLNAGSLSLQAREVQKELAGIRRGIAMLGSVFLAVASGALSYFFYQAHVEQTAFRLELGFYGFSVLFVYLMIRR